MNEAIQQQVEASPYGAALGVRLHACDDEQVELRLPYRDENSNPGKALHGGCAASLAAMGGLAVTARVLGSDAAPLHTAGLQVNYLAAAIGEEVVAHARLLRRGKAMCFVEIELATLEGKSIAHATSMVRGRFGAPPPDAAPHEGDDGRAEPGPMGPHIGKMPFMGGRGIEVEHMSGGTSRLVMPAKAENRDLAGGVHEGALLALLDTTGAMAAWGFVGPGPYKASTPALQARIHEAPPDEDLVAYGRCVQRDQDLLWNDVAVVAARSRRIVAQGNVIYRIVT